MESGIVSIYEQPTQYFLHPFGRAPTSPWRASAPRVALPLDASDAALGEAVLYLMTECRQDVMAFTHWERSRQETLALLKPARVRSWMALQRKGKLVSVKLEDGSFRIAPTRNGGNRGEDAGFHDVEEQAEIIRPNAGGPTIGAAVRRALLVSTPPPAA